MHGRKQRGTEHARNKTPEKTQAKTPPTQHKITQDNNTPSFNPRTQSPLHPQTRPMSTRPGHTTPQPLCRDISTGRTLAGHQGNTAEHKGNIQHPEDNPEHRPGNTSTGSNDPQQICRCTHPHRLNRSKHTGSTHVRSISTSRTHPSTRSPAASQQPPNSDASGCRNTPPSAQHAATWSSSTKRTPQSAFGLRGLQPLCMQRSSAAALTQTAPPEVAVMSSSRTINTYCSAHAVG